MVLSCYSKFFVKAFQVEMKEKYENSVTIHNMSTKSMQTIIDFIYTGKITLRNKILQKVCLAKFFTCE